MLKLKSKKMSTTGILAENPTFNGPVYNIVISQNRSSEAADAENSPSRSNVPLPAPRTGCEDTSPRQLEVEICSLLKEDIPSPPDSQSSRVLPCCGYTQQESMENPAVLCRHILTTDKSLDRKEPMNSDSDELKIRNKEVTLRNLHVEWSRNRPRLVELVNVRMKNLKNGRSLLQKLFQNRVNFPEVVYMSLKYDRSELAGKTLKKEWMSSLLFYVPGKHKWNNLWKASPKEAQVFLKVNGIVYVHMKKAGKGNNALLLGEWRKLNADEYLSTESTRKDLNYFHCLERTISLDLLSSCKGLKELNLHNCYFPTTANSGLPNEGSSKDFAHRLCNALCELPQLSKITFEARRFKNSCFDLSLISKRNRRYSKLHVVLGHTQVIWSDSSTTGYIEDLNSLAECNFSKILFCKCIFKDCGYTEASLGFETQPECGIIELEKQNATVTLKLSEFQWMENGADARGQRIPPHLKTDYYHLFQMYNFYTREYWESKVESTGNKINDGSTPLISH